jgi:tetratricopeptide (TPR) repeat protein
MPEANENSDRYEAPLVRGVYSTQKVRKSNSWTSAGRSVHKTYWYVKQLGDNAFQVQPLSDNHTPTGQPRLIDREDFLCDYTPEMDYYIRNVLPALKELDEHLERGDAHRKRREYYSAEAEYAFAQDIDEQSVRAAFGLGFVHLERGESAKARQVFERIVSMETPFRPEHKHLFNEFGIALRKNRLFDESLQYYFRAVELDSDDEHLFYNIARSYYEKGDYKHCMEHIALCLKLNRGVEEAQKFCRGIIRQHEEELAKRNRHDPEVHFQLIHDASRILDSMTEAAGLSPDEEDSIREKIRIREEKREERRKLKEERKKARFDVRFGSPYNTPDILINGKPKPSSEELDAAHETEEHSPPLEPENSAADHVNQDELIPDTDEEDARTGEDAPEDAPSPS